MIRSLPADFGREHFFKRAHADRGRYALDERAGGGSSMPWVWKFSGWHGVRSQAGEMLELVGVHVRVAGQI